MFNPDTSPARIGSGERRTETMADVMSTRKRLLAVAAAASFALAAVGGTALAGHLTGGVKSYTGCLANGGTLSLIQEGDTPKRACPSGSVEAHFSGGDITSITGGTGIQVTNGTNGDVTVAVDPKYALRQDCSNGQVVKWFDSWQCAKDEDTTYTNGIGLELSGTEFRIAPDYRVKNDQACPSGQFATGIASGGSLECGAPPPPPTNQAYAKYVSTAAVFKGSFSTAASLSLPAGKYVVTATATAHDDDTNETTVQCSLYQGATFLGGSEVVADDVVDAGSPDLSAQGSIAITAAATLDAAGKVELRCASTRGNDSLSNVAVTAIQVDGVTVQ
jgi:hypothetical protein